MTPKQKIVFLYLSELRVNSARMFLFAVIILSVVHPIFSQTNSQEDINSDTLLSDFDKSKLFFNLSKTFDNNAAKAVKFDSLGMILAEKHNWNRQLVLAAKNYARHLNLLCNYKLADSALNEIESNVMKSHKGVELGDYYYQRAANYYDWSRYQDAKLYYEKALEQYKTHQNKLGIAKTLKGLGIVVSIWADYESSIGYLQQARDIYTELDDKQGIESINLAIGVVMEHWNKIDVSLKYYKNALSYYEEKEDLFNQANLRLHIGDLYLKKGNYHKALDYYFTAKNIEKLHPHKKLRSIALSNIGEAYYFLGKYKKALEYQNDALNLKYEIGDRKRIAISLIDLGKIHLALKNYSKAVEYGRKAYSITTATKLNPETIESLHLLSEGFYNMGKPDSAYYYLNKYIAVKDKIFSEENNKTLNNLKIKYDTREKEKENQMLKIKNAQNELEIRKERYSKYLTLIITVFIFLIALVIIIFLRAKQIQNKKTNFILQFKNREITKQKEELSSLNQELIESRSKYMSIVENATIGMYRTTRSGEVLFANKTLLNMLNTTWKELQKINLNVIKPDRAELLNLVETQKIITGREDIWQRGDGSQMYVNESIWLVENISGKTTYYEGIVEDITKRKIAENSLIDKEKTLTKINKELIQKNKELEKAKIEIEKAYKTKSEFLANISHEIRTPLNAIIGYTDLLLNKIKQPGYLQYLQAIHSSGRNMLSLINDILDLSKIQTGKLELHFEPVILNDILSDIKQIFTLAVKEKNLDFIIQFHPSISKLIFLDDTRIRQILFNLIGNAVKFTDKGYIKLKVDVANETTDKMDIIFYISDTGSGIPKSKQSDIFEAFVQNDHNGKHTGTGLGLSITKRLIEILNGTITLDSTPNKGTLFTIKLPGIKIFKGKKTGNKVKRDRNSDFTLNSGEIVSTTEIKFSNSELNQLAKSDFENLFKDRCLAIKDGHFVNDIILCSDNIINFAKNHSFLQLTKLAEALKKSSENYDIENMKLLLHILTGLFNKIESNERQ